MEDLAAVVREVVLEVARVAEPATAAVGDGDRLTGDLGLESLDLAQIVATLEARTSLDPFAELVAITSVRTVGDLVDAYRRARDGEAPADDGDLAASSSRARARRRAKRRRVRA